MDDFLLEETERNLRALSFIRAARISKFLQRDGTTVIVVYVNDSWTTEPQLNLSGINKIDDIEFGFKEKNFLGYGKSMSVFYNTNSDNDFNRKRYRFTDPRVFGSRWRFQAETSREHNEKIQEYEMTRPFYSADTKWSVRADYSKTDAVTDEFSKNSKISEFDQFTEVSQFFARFKLGKGRKVVHRLGGGIDEKANLLLEIVKPLAIEAFRRATDFKPSSLIFSLLKTTSSR